MASNHVTVARTIQTFIDRTLSPEAISKQFAIIARGHRDAAIARGEAPPDYTTFVDGKQGALEETTRPGGAVVYRFNLMGRVIRRALEEYRKALPEQSGDLADSIVVSVNDKPWLGDYDDVPADAEVMIVATAPYARKVEVGGMAIRVPAHPIERVRKRLQSTFQTMFFGQTFVILPASFSIGGFDTPYILKGQYHGASFIAGRRARAFKAGRLFHAPGRSQRGGEQLTYPALTISVTR